MNVGSDSDRSTPVVEQTDLSGETDALFRKLDTNSDGIVDFSELEQYFHERQLASGEEKRETEKFKQANNFYANALSNIIPKDSSGFGFREFAEYLGKTDNQLKIFFKELDLDQNGKIDKSEIKKGFENMGKIFFERRV